MRRVIACAFTLALLGVPATAGAAAPWSAPIAIGPSTPCAATVAFGSVGAGVVSWSPSCVSGPRRTRLASTSGRLLRTVPRVLAQPLLAYGTRTVLLRQRLLTRATDFRHDSRTRLDVAFGRTSGTLGTSRTLVTIKNLEHLAFAASPRGDVAVGWIEFTCKRNAKGDCLSSRRRLRVMVRPAGKSFRAPVTLASDTRSDGSQLSDSDPALAFGPQGDLAVAYTGLRGNASHLPVVLSRVRRAGHAFGGAVVVGPRRELTDIDTAVTSTGAVFVAWGSQDGGEEANLPFIVRAARRASGAAFFGVARVLDPGAGIARSPSRVALGVAPNGTATVAWSQAVGVPVSSFPVRVATSNAAGVFGPSADLAAFGAVHDIAVNRQGSTLVVWGRISLADPQQADQIMAAVRLGGATSFGAAETVSGLDQPSIADAAFDPVTRQPVIVWTARKATATLTTPGVRLSRRTAVQASLARSFHHACRH
jgi:hypothetical protein